MLFRLDNPQTSEEWQQAVNCAAHELLLAGWKRQGKIWTGITFDVDGARATLAAGGPPGYCSPDAPPA